MHRGTTVTAVQGSLFDAPVERGASRQADPWTSREAGRSMSGAVLRAQQALVLEAVAQAAPRLDLNCVNAYEVVRHLGERAPQQSVVSKRIGELVDLGLLAETGIARPGGSNRLCLCYRVTPLGNRWLVGAVA